MKFEEILEACWKGYHKEGMKTMFGKRYPNCVKNKKKSNEDIDQQGVAEGGAETSWSDGNEKITLHDILELTKHIKQINLPINDNLKNKLLHWDGNPEEIERINQVTLSNQFPILVMVDEQGQINWILDGNHRLHKAIKAQAETIPAKLIKPGDLNDKAKKIFNIKEQGVAEGARVARKPGQPAGSKKHSDLYTDENHRGTITGLKFATVEDARASVSKIRNSGRSHAHKIQAAVAMEQRARAAGKASAAAVYRRYINANKRTDEQQLDEKCWDGYAQQGMKKKGDRMVPNCVRVAEDHTPDHTTAMSLAQDLNTMMADVAEIRHAGEVSTNLNYLRELQRRIGVTQKQILNLGYKYDVNHPDLVRPLGQALAEIETGPEITMKELLYKAAAQAMRDAGREGIAMDYEDAIEQASRIYNIPYRPSELPKLRAQLKDLDQRLEALRAQKALGKQMRQQQKYGTTAADSASAAKIAPRLDRIKPATKTLEETEAELAEDLKKWFKEKWVRFGPDGKIRGPCARGSSKEGKPKCLPQSKAHALGKKGRASAAAKKRREDPNPERRGPARNVATKVKEAASPAQQAAIAIAMKRAGKKPKSVTEGIPFDQCPACGGPIVHISLLSEKQDACYHKVKSRYKVWPSAYASGALVQCRKKGAANWGTGGKKK